MILKFSEQNIRYIGSKFLGNIHGGDKLLLPTPYEGVKLLKGDTAHTQPQKYYLLSRK